MIRSRNWGLLLAWGSVATGILLFAAFAFRLSVSRDSGGFLTISSLMLDGAKLYADIMDRKGPLLWGTVEMLFRVTGPSLVAARSLVLIAGLFCGWLTWRAAGSAGQSGAWQVTSLAAYSIFLPLHSGFRLLTEQGVLVFGMLSVLPVLSRADGSISRRALVISGLLLGIGTGYKLSAVFYVAGIGLWGIICALHDRRNAWNIVVDAATFGVAWMIPVVLVLAWFIPSGRFDGALYGYLLSNVADYPSLPFAQWTINILRGQVLRGAMLWPPAAILGAVALARFIRRGEDRKIALLALIVAFSFIPSLKRTYDHYVIAYLPILAILAVEGWRRFAAYLAERNYNVAIAAGAAAVLALGPVRHLAVNNLPEVMAHGLSVQRDIAARIDEYVKPADPFYVVAGDPQYYFLSGRYRHNPPLFVLPGNETFAPPERLLNRIDSEAGARYVLLVESALPAIEEYQREVRARGTLLFAKQVPQRERVEFYRLPDHRLSDATP